jgi:D-alanine-D-alanine ligase
VFRVPPVDDDPELLATLLANAFKGRADRIAIAAHGELGGSGLLHAAAGACGLPVLGPKPAAIAASYDKLVARTRLRFHNIPVPRTVVLPSPDTSSRERALARLGWPCVVKPRRGSCAAGIRRVREASELRPALESVCGLEPEALVEREIPGREVSVVLLGGEVLGSAEIDRRGGRTRTMVCPPGLDGEALAGIHNLARRAAGALELLDGPTRVDLIVSPRDNEVVLEVEALPPIHRDSVVARVACAAGLSYPQLVARMLELPARQPTRDTPAERNFRSAPTASFARVSI